MGLRDIEANLPPGFRFYPSDEELVCHYLHKKITNQKLSNGASMVEVDLHACEPWQLPDVAKLGEKEWYFFTFRERKYATGYRTNRATTSGYWKATGKDKPVYDPTTREIVGMRKTLVFYRDRAPNGIKTDWVMHEFRMENQLMIPNKDWVLCRVFHKSKGELNAAKRGFETDHDEINTAHDNTKRTKLTVSSSCYTDDHYQTMSASGGCHDPQKQQQQLLTTLQQFIPQFNSSIASSPTPLLNLGVLLNTNSLDDDDHQFISAQHEQEEHNSRNGDEFGFLYDMFHDENNSLGTYM